MHQTTRRTLAALAVGVLGAAHRSHAQNVASYLGFSPYTQDFDGLPAETTVASFPSGPGSFALTDPPVSGTAVEGWYASRPSGTDTLQFMVTNGDTGGAAGFLASAGSSGDTDRALGSISSATAMARFGALVRNDSATTFNTVTLSFDVEQWRNGGSGTVSTSAFSFGLFGGTNAANASIDNGNFTAVTDGDLTSKVTGTTAGPLNGNADANRTGKTLTLQGVTWAPGDVLAIRWDDQAGGDLLALDNLSLDARRIPNLVWNPARTTGLWDTDPGNRPWLDGTRPSSFENTNNVTFGDAPNDIAVTVDDFGVSPGTMSVTNAAKTYTFTGGPIGGNLAKSGAGTMVLASANQFAQVDVMGGTLRVSGSLGSDAIVTVGSSGTSVATFEAAATQTVKTLTVNNGGVVSVTRGDVSGAPASVLIVGDNLNPAPLTIQTGGTNTGRVDVGTGGLVVDHPTGGDAASLATVRGYIASGYNGAGGGAAVWSGAGIVSSGAAADSSKSVGYALATEVLPFANGATTDTFMGASVDKSSVVVRFTLAGDATLDGAVDFNDLVKLAQNYDIADGSRDWNQGDFTYDGNVDFNDLVKLAQNYNVALPPDGVPGASAAFEADLARAFSAVPEPGSLALLSAIGTMLLPRRRRRD